MNDPKHNKKNLELSGQTLRNDLKFKISSLCNHGQCVGVAKVSSMCNYGQCVGVLKNQEAIVVQDTKNKNEKPLSFTYDEWKAFVAGVKNGEFDLESL